MTYATRFQYLLDKATVIAQARTALNPVGSPLPVLFFVTDPARIAHPEDIAEHLPQGCGIIYRHFGEAHALQRAQLLSRIARLRNLTLLIGDDADLAFEVGAHGVHLPERNLDKAPGLAAEFPDFILTAACHSLETLHRPEIDALDAVFASPVFASRSASATEATTLGVKGIRGFVDASPVPVYGLGGISCDTIPQLRDTGLFGVAAVDAFSLKD
ncbi:MULTISPECIES: thiamine phosphate synthase [Asticcacaulis]|uniref:thiamine phosphate synthase n=1 Tax=Asticcacaulis TaxID=76890 RepID=UPI001AE2AFB7|nr:MULTISPECIES: thiamine phosphate synthase [Asticcacaulis]MBP2159919.1 thiamine-phosphate pyrophosphorylase [Asticcacaulis solisilvae]MDR6800964.1 thiamine-phosphate pyrophosphorylase [Asticcacaulis sp. BE141]